MSCIVYSPRYYIYSNYSSPAGRPAQAVFPRVRMRGKVSPPIIRAHAYIVSSHFSRITLAEVEHKTTQCHWIDGEEADLSVLVNGTSSKHVIASDSDSDAGEGSSFVSFGVRSLYMVSSLE